MLLELKFNIVSWLGAKQWFGYQILSACLHCVAWLYTIPVICVERKRMLPSIPARGHGPVLLLFWTASLACDALALLSWFSDEWWFSNRT